jgi:hypothetical protein
MALIEHANLTPWAAITGPRRAILPPDLERRNDEDPDKRWVLAKSVHALRVWIPDLPRDHDPDARYRDQDAEAYARRALMPAEMHGSEPAATSLLLCRKCRTADRGSRLSAQGAARSGGPAPSGFQLCGSPARSPAAASRTATSTRFPTSTVSFSARRTAGNWSGQACSGQSCAAWMPWSPIGRPSGR